jgi:hypothetical protein
MFGIGRHTEEVANRKLGKVEGFQWYAWRIIDPDAVLMTGDVPTGIYTRGPRKGRPKFPKGDGRSVVVTEAEELAEKQRYEAESGKCGDCCGRGEVFASWHHIEGTKYRPCGKCGGSGLHARPQADAAVDPQAGSTTE